jgi:aldose 1-epimerase
MVRICINLFLLLIPIFILSCVKEENDLQVTIQKEKFGETPDGRVIHLYTLKNPNGIKVKIINYGAAIVSIEVPDKNGNFADIVLGYDSLDGYINDSVYLGVTVGRYANRIAGGKFTIDGVEYRLAKNNGENHLHGGIEGFFKKVWSEKNVFSSKEKAGIELSYLSKDKEEGYPGNLQSIVKYTLTPNNELIIEYEASTDKPTPVNLTNHSYFNLKGQGNGDILNHRIMLNAKKYTPVDEGLIPTGEIKSVEGTPLDFTKIEAIGARIDELDEKFGGGYDHNFILEGVSDSLVLAAKVIEPESGRVLEIYTTKPGIQFYTGNYLKNIKGKSGKIYKKYFGFCLEPQYFPDSPNKPNFPSSILKPNETRKELIVYKFLTK